MNPKLTPEHFTKRALIYVRQSTAGQVLHHQESQRRQYGLADHARTLGFRQVEVIDEDLGRSGSGLVARPGFQRLVGEICTGTVGAIFCLEASRLARNGRDWHHVIELCGLVGAIIIDPDGIYDPAVLNDRLLLGLKGTMSEFELNLLRQRSLEALRQKARRGELKFCLPIGYVWTAHGKIEQDPDRRVQQAVHQVFVKMTELGSIRQVLLWYRHERVSLPARVYTEAGSETIWKLPTYSSLLKILTNPLYAGAYAFGKTQAQTTMIDGRAQKTDGHRKPRQAWTVLIRDHHPGYIAWDHYERNQAAIAANSRMKSRMEPKAGRGGRALLAGLLRCRRCGRMLHVGYTGTPAKVVRYYCRGAHLNHGEAWCISFGGIRPDEAVAREVLFAISGHALEAAIDAAARQQEQRQAQRQALMLELEHARYEARIAARRYDAVDPDNRLVAVELEARWNATLKTVAVLEQRLQGFDHEVVTPPPDRAVLLTLAQDLPAVWQAPSTDMRLKQRIVRILIREVIADIDDAQQEIVLLLHWAGGSHSEVRVKKNATGKHRRCTSLEALGIARQLARTCTDGQIAGTLNRLGLRTGCGNTWNERRVQALRYEHHLPAYDAPSAEGAVVTVTLEEAAQRLGVSPNSVRRLITEQVLPATQVIMSAPWHIPIDALQTTAVQETVRRIQQRQRRRQPAPDEAITTAWLPTFQEIQEQGLASAP
jgi:DNA invertase Pin-like site-specific DNA recombinase